MSAPKAALVLPACFGGCLLWWLFALLSGGWDWIYSHLPCLTVVLPARARAHSSVSCKLYSDLLDFVHSCNMKTVQASGFLP